MRCIVCAVIPEYFHLIRKRNIVATMTKLRERNQQGKASEKYTTDTNILFFSL